MMDISLPTYSPRITADLRASVDAAATARSNRPPLAVVQEMPLTPVSFGQEALVAQGVLGSPDPTPVTATNPLPDWASRDAPERVLKPWGVPMLPADVPREASPASARRITPAPSER